MIKLSLLNKIIQRDGVKTFTPLFVFAFFLLNLIQVKGQVNLVPNYSFEDTLSCPQVQGVTFFSYTPPWFSPTLNTPDIFNSCSEPYTMPCVNVPLTSAGFQYARTGNGYAGFHLRWNNGREYLSVKLVDSLKANHKYCVRFYLSLIDSARWAINKSGLYFSKDSVFISNYGVLPYTPQIEYNSGFLSDTVNWMEVSGTYTAIGEERFITIGNFYDDANTDTLLISDSHVEMPYYFIDDVFVYDCTDTIIPEDTNSLTLVNAFTPNGDGKNDYFNIKGTNISSVHLKIINRWGLQLYEGMGENVKWDGRYEGNEVNPGVYYYIVEVIFKDGEIRNKAGSVHLIKN